MKKTLTLLLLLAGISGEVRAETLFWNGSGGHMTWNTEDTNWSQGGASVKYSDGNDVVFADNGSGTVTLSGTFVPASVTVTTRKDYIFDGTGKLTGNMQLDKFQTGTLTINTANDYTGDTNIYEGTLVIGNDHALGTGTIKLFGNTTLNLGQKNLSNKVSLEQGETAFIGNGSISSDLIVGNGKTLTLIGNLDGRGEITLGQSTTLDLGKNTLNNNVSLSGETASIGNGSIHGDVVVGDGKTLIFIGNLKVYGQINLGNNTTLHLGNNTLFNDVSLSGSASIGNGYIHGDVVVGNGKTLTLIDKLNGSGEIKLSDNATLNLGQYTHHINVAFAGETAFIGNGCIDSVLSVGDGKTLTLIGDLEGYQINLGNNTTLDLGKNTLNMYHVNLSGSTTIGNGTIEGDLQVAEGKKLSLQQQITVTGTVNLAANAALDLGGNAFHQGGDVGNRVAFAGDATIGNGTITGDLDVAANQNLTLLHDTTVTGTVNLAANASLDLGKNAFHQGGDVGNRIAFAGDATIGNGTITGDLSVAAGKQITLLAGTTITGGVTLGDNASLDLGKNAVTGAVTLAGSATIGNGTIEGDMAVEEGKSLALLANTTVTGAISLGQNSTLNLGGNTITQDVGVSGSTTIGNGSVNGNITFAAGNQQVSLCGALGGTGDISIGVVNSTSTVPHPTFTSTLNLGGHTLTKGLKLVGDTTVSNGKLVLAHDMTRSLDDIQARTVTIGAETTVDLNSHTFSHNLAVEADTAIGNGTIGGNVTVDEGKSVRFFGETKIDSNNEGLVSYHGKIEAGDMTIQALHRPLGSQIGAPVYPGLLKELTVSKNEILGTGRASSLAAGLEIQSEADLMIQGMTITADNKISVGDNTITLQDVTIKLSQASYELVSGVYYFNLSDLFHCSVDMTDVTFDASDLTLPEGFNPETNGISFNLGDAKLTAETAERDIYLLMGGYGSRTMSIDGQGRPVFTALVPIPEPTTGTLGLLALATLAARRRRK